jgi:hypothetical protein
MTKPNPLYNNRKFASYVHDRWYKKLYNADREPEIDQCSACRFYIKLQGIFESDWGVCANAKSEKDARLVFEHDSCEHYDFVGEEYL